VGHALLESSVLKFAVSAGHLAVRAEMVALAKNQGQDELAGFSHGRGGGAHNHVLHHRQGAGGLEGAHALYLYQADPAGPEGLQCRMIAQAGDFDSSLLRCPQHGGAFRDFNGYSVDLEVDHC